MIETPPQLRPLVEGVGHRLTQRAFGSTARGNNVHSARISSAHDSACSRLNAIRSSTLISCSRACRSTRNSASMRITIFTAVGLLSLRPQTGAANASNIPRAPVSDRPLRRSLDSRRFAVFLPNLPGTCAVLHALGPAGNRKRSLFPACRIAIGNPGVLLRGHRASAPARWFHRPVNTMLRANPAASLPPPSAVTRPLASPSRPMSPGQCRYPLRAPTSRPAGTAETTV